MAIATERVWTRDEMWEGVLVMPPLANNEHQRIVSKLTSAFSSVIDWDAGEQALPSANVSDRDGRTITATPIATPPATVVRTGTAAPIC